jgi:hypothetical protein
MNNKEITAYVLPKSPQSVGYSPAKQFTTTHKPIMSSSVSSLYSTKYKNQNYFLLKGYGKPGTDELPSIESPTLSQRKKSLLPKRSFMTESCGHTIESQADSKLAHEFANKLIQDNRAYVRSPGPVIDLISKVKQ